MLNRKNGRQQIIIIADDSLSCHGPRCSKGNYSAGLAEAVPGGRLQLWPGWPLQCHPAEVSQRPHVSLFLISTSFEIDPEIINQYRSSTSLHTGDQSRLTILPQNFSTLKTHCQESGRKYDVVLADLGYNSLQLEKHDGFSWKRDTPLDMRYNK